MSKNSKQFRADPATWATIEKDPHLVGLSSATIIEALWLAWQCASEQQRQDAGLTARCKARGGQIKPHTLPMRRHIDRDAKAATNRKTTSPVASR